MELISDEQLIKKESKNIEPFLRDIFSDHLKVNYKGVPEIRTSNTPDYLINEDIFVEVKELHDGIDMKRSAQWGIITNKLQKVLSEKFKEEKLKGLYSVETPNVYRLVGDNNYAKVVSNIVDGIKAGKNTVESLGISFKIEKINDKYNEIYLSSSSGASSINPAGVVFQNVSRKLETANKQLGYSYESYKVKRKVILLVNKYIFADRISEVIEGLSYCYNDLLKYANIDEIWFQQETRDGKFFHTKIYDRAYLKKFEKSQIDPDSEENQTQFQLWYWALDKMGNKQDELFDALKKFLEKYKPEDIFTDKFKRETMVRLGIWLIDNNRSEDAIWLINKFINDPDPVKPEDYEGDDKFDYHKQLENNEDPTIITTVMGHLAWTVQALVRKSKQKDIKNLVKGFEFAEQVLTNTNNLYVVQQWMVPLVEIANRRLWIAEKNIDIYKRFRSLLLDERKGLVVKYGDVPGIAKYMANIFNYFKDLTTEETELLLRKISHVDQAMSVLIYFAIFRLGHYKKVDPIGKTFGVIEPKIWDYKPNFAIKTLRELIKENKEDHRMQTTAWNFWKIIKDDPDQFKTLDEWVDLLFALSANFSVYPYLQFILEDNIEKHPQECKKWLEKLVNTTIKYIDDHSAQEFIQRESLHIPNTLSWLETNDPTYYISIKGTVDKLINYGVLS